jgi:hypothetical protein
LKFLLSVLLLVLKNAKNIFDVIGYGLEIYSMKYPHRVWVRNIHFHGANSHADNFDPILTKPTDNEGKNKIPVKRLLSERISQSMNYMWCGGQ